MNYEIYQNSILMIQQALGPSHPLTFEVEVNSGTHHNFERNIFALFVGGGRFQIMLIYLI